MDLCARCLGRQLDGANGLDRQIEAAKASGQTTVPESECPVCEGAFQRTDALMDLAVETLDSYEYKSFQLGTLFPKSCEENERQWKADHGIEHTESVRTEMNRLLGPDLEARLGKQLIKDGRPDVALKLDFQLIHVDVEPNPVYVLGRYNKYRRDIPQTKWPCKSCQGTGCFRCAGTGEQYAESVQQAIAAVMRRHFDAKDDKFHGSGREDIDALMLGGGRPFVLELLAPRLRTADLQAIEAEVNAETERTGVAIHGLTYTPRETVAEIKEADYQKRYVAHCVMDAPVSTAQVQAAIDALRGVELDQRTPERVSHRRADLIRNRTVSEIEWVEPVSEDGLRFSIGILAESGTYIKEFVSGDEGRTQPNFCGTIGIPGRVEFLDVMDILDGPTVDANAS